MEDNSQPKSAAQSTLSISEAAHRNHEEWFPPHKSTLKITDPDLIEIFDNFAFDEVIAYGRLDTKTRVIVTLASIIGSQALSEYKVMLAAAVSVGVTPVEVKEIVSAIRGH
jgi:4-carboxymuconolactone decarboxylase